MTNSVCRFYIVNQLLCGVEFDKLVPQAQEELASSQLVERYRALSKLPALSLDKMQSTMLNFLRMQQYDYCLSSTNHKVLTLRDVVRLVRSKDMAPSSVDHWAAACFKEVKEISKGTPYIQDGILYTTAEFLSRGYNLDKQMRRMFALYCWGSEKPNSSLKEFVLGWVKLTQPGQDTLCSTAWLEKQFALLEASEVGSKVIGSAALTVSDLNPVLAVSGVPAQYSSPSAESVLVRVPTKSNNKVVCVELSTPDFVKLSGLEGRGLVNAFVRAGQLVVGGTENASSGS